MNMSKVLSEGILSKGKYSGGGSQGNEAERKLSRKFQVK